MSSSKNTRDEMGSRPSRYSESQNSNSQPGYSSPPTLPSSTSRQMRSDVSKARLGLDDDVRPFGIASPRAGRVVTPPMNLPGGRSSRTEATRSYDYNAPREFENDIRSSGIAPSAPHTPPMNPPKWSPQTNYSRSWEGNVDEVLLSRIASASPFTPPTSSPMGYSPQAKATMSDTSRVRRGFQDNVRLGIASASPLTPPTSPPNNSRQPNTGISPSRRGLEDGLRSSGIAPSVLRAPLTSPPRDESALAPKEKPAGNRNHIEVSRLKINLGLNVRRCCCIKDNGEPCNNPRSKDTDVQIISQLESMITLTRSSPEFESELKKLVMIVHCRYHLSPKFKEPRIETWTTVFPNGDGDTEPSVEKQIRKALGQVSTQCIRIMAYNERCEERTGGRKVQNCSKTIDEIVKPEVYLDDANLDFYLEVLEANMYCHLHINRRPLKYVAQWKSSIFEIRKRAGSKVIPSVESNALGGSRSQTPAPDARGTRRYSTNNNNTLVLQNQGLPTPRSSRSLTPGLARDPATFWPETYDTTPFDILLRSNRVADYTSSYHLIQNQLERPLDDVDQKDGYVYLYEVEGNSGFVKLGYTSRSVEVRHQEWNFDCNRVPRALYPITSSSAIPVRSARRVEALCHAELDHCRIRIYCKGCLKQHIEWFEISPAEAIAVIRKWSNWTATLPYEMPRLRSEVWRLKEEERQKVRNIDRFMKELLLNNRSSELNLGNVEAGLRRDLR
ncbi:uncharacterized protein PAC_15813 [Phialocephala subalpina]|uniref:Bacteriophage T5 Orf172 DNA-binding domain-containing protein n=1 Tax=Phialocephala subalpina TaxID=576137 RepID=A0A1L7XLL3_9HELO|nr:uncharacterized protein PAC_15813 [Phialocephala subalpina]